MEWSKTMSVMAFFSLVLKEIGLRKKELRFFMVSIIASSVGILLFSVLNTGITDYLQQKMEQTVECKIVTIPLELGEESQEILEYISKIPHISGVCEYEWIFNAYDQITYMEIDGTEYAPSNLKAINNAEDTFVHAEIELLEEESIVWGRDFTKEDSMKAIIDKKSLLYLGMKDADIIGKEAVLRSGNREITVEIVGVFDIEQGKEENDEKKFYDGQNRLLIGEEPLIITKDAFEVLMGNNIIDGYYHYIDISVDSIHNVDKVYDEIAKLDVTLFSESKSLRSFIMNLDTIKEMLHLLAMVLLVVALINMSGSLWTTLAESRRWYEILFVMGYRKINIILLVLAEFVCLTAVALGIGTMIILLLVRLLSVGFAELNMGEIKFETPLNAIFGLSALVIGLTAGIVVSMTLLTLRRKRR